MATTAKPSKPAVAFSSSSISLSFDFSRIDKAVSALVKHVHSKQKKQPTTSLLNAPNSNTLFLLFGVKRIPQHVKPTPVQISLPHSLYDESTDVCVIVKDPQRKWKDLFAKERIPEVQKIIGLKKLLKKFNSFKARRELCSAFELFVCDDRLVDRMPAALGKFFISSKKLPIGLKIRENNVAPPIQNALESTWLQLRCGPTVAVKIGRASMPVLQIVDNAKAVIQAVDTFYRTDPKWKNSILSIHLQATDTVALPIYDVLSTLPPLADGTLRLSPEATVNSPSVSSNTTKKTETATNELVSKKKRFRQSSRAVMRKVRRK
ncbi:hypothetical protein IE077_001507 [Cardiosporidium cionae]|uniref:Ribosomal protein L1 n=1 Tax=Cardiosporidium cionae TaxID=476202 RepID=A0ABQ7J5C1_9APIC|nr:hypothetical protein IE077_001507 [Cardiosporidium cionae]|eukprot:KAF8819177.1 hypothetical protein IE077_001507 [Cardiosporidium cionae]